MNRVIRVALRGVALAALACGGTLGTAGGAAAALPPIKHVFVIVGENESASTTFGASSPAPYLSQTLKAEGAYIQNYYGVGHSSLDNYVAMVSGQAPNMSTSADCGTFADFPSPTSMNSAGQENGEGCVYPTDVPTLMSQMDTAHLTWKGYMDSMGADPARDSATCSHPTVGNPDLTEGGETAAPFDEYATRHDPFVYFHSVIDNATECNANVVNLSHLTTDLSSIATTPNYTFVTPDLCNDGHDGTGVTCPGGGGLAQFDKFLQTTVPEITNSPAYKQDGLLIVLFDEAVGDATSCCGELPGPGEPFPGGGTTGTGGGITGAVLLSQYIKPGTVTQTAYNHYSMLGSVEDLFGLARIGDAKGTTAFGSDVFTKPPVAPVISSFKVKPASFSHKHEAATITYTESEAATTKLTFEKISKGDKKKGKKSCTALKAGKKKPKHTSSCTVIKVLGTISHTDTAGANKIAFNGKIKGHSLAAGSYIVSAVPTASGLNGKPHTAKFKVT
jgi:phosphatidylinositol-3-phosphatase